MIAIEDSRATLALSRVQSGLREGANSRELAVDLAQEINQEQAVIENTVEQAGEQGIPLSELSVTTRQLDRTRKIAEVLEDGLGLSVGHRKFATVASTGANLTSVGALLVAGENLLQASESLSSEYNSVGTVAAVADRTYDNFFRATCIFSLECFLFATPINFKIAWRGTRYLNNRYLYHLRDISNSIYRLILSEVHYLIRGVGPGIIRSGEIPLMDYLAWVVTNTLEIIYQVEEPELQEIPGQIESTLSEFQDFVIAQYNVAESHVDSLDSIDLKGTITSQLSELDDFPNVGDILSTDSFFD